VKYNELNKKSVDELKKMGVELKVELFQLRLKHKTSQLDKKAQIGVVRRDIARIETKLTELRNS
jgi:large subunit ribosomal protein L29